MVDEIKKQGRVWGVYSNGWHWKRIVGLDFTGVSEWELWYPNWDN